MKVSIFGLGYVGSVTATCLASQGHHVTGVDANPAKVAQVAAGRSTVIEPELDEMIKAATANNRLTATLDASQAVADSEISLICVGTPSNGNGSIHLGHVKRVCQDIGDALRTKTSRHVVVIRSTVLPGTAEEVVLPTLEAASGRRRGVDLNVCVNPEFLREGSAVRDYYNPSYIVIGADSTLGAEAVASLYSAIEAPVIHTSLRTAEMVKYASNAFHAVKITFANEIGVLCKQQGIDGREVMDLVCQDPMLNISAAYLRPGFAFGGSCLPKDVRALLHRAKQTDVDCPVIESILESNERHLHRAIRLVENAGNQNIGVLGLSFKPGTDDVRESPIVSLVETLLGRGYLVRIYDNLVAPDRLVGENKASLERDLPHVASLMRNSAEAVISEAKTLVLATSDPGFKEISPYLRPDHHVIDLAGIVPQAASYGIQHEGVCW